MAMGDLERIGLEKKKERKGKKKSGRAHSRVYKRTQEKHFARPMLEQDAREEVTVLMSSVNLAKTALWVVSFA